MRQMFTSIATLCLLLAACAGGDAESGASATGGAAETVETTQPEATEPETAEPIADAVTETETAEATAPIADAVAETETAEAVADSADAVTETETTEAVADSADDDADAVNPSEPAADASDAEDTSNPVIEFGDRFPQVLAVEASESESDAWRFSVTLSSLYDTPQRYADAWRVLDADDNELGIRVLLHDHANEQPFTRSEQISVPSGTTTVFVEGRDQDNGWSGQRFEFTLPTASGADGDDG